MSAETLQALNITAITLAALSGLFGVYLVLFLLSIWATYQQDTVSSKRLRWVTIVLFLDLLAHFITRSLQFSRARLENDSKEELLRWSIPLTVVGNVTTTIAGFLSDGTLAWRFYIIFGREKWALYLPSASVIMNALLCWSGDGLHLAIYFNEELYKKLLPITLDITVAWGWSMFFANSLMTGGIIYKIMVVIESALVTWIGILMCEIGLLAPTGYITTNQNVGFVLLDIIPIFFGISQTLITARLGIVRETSDSMEKANYYSSASESNPQSGTIVFTDVIAHTDFQGEEVETKTGPGGELSLSSCDIGSSC